MCTLLYKIASSQCVPVRNSLTSSNHKKMYPHELRKLLSRKSRIWIIYCRSVVHGSILCDPIQPSPSTGGPEPTQPNPTQLKSKILDPTQLNPTQPNGTMEQCYSQCQNPQAKDEAKARTLTAEAKAKAKDTNFCP